MMSPHDGDPEDGEAEPNEAKRRMALVVDSDSESAQVIMGFLRDLGFEVTAVQSGVAAVIAARNTPPVVILLAAQLSDVTSAELVIWLRSNPALVRVPIVALHSSGETDADLMAAGFNARLRKPTTASKVAQALERACASPA